MALNKTWIFIKQLHAISEGIGMQSVFDASQVVITDLFAMRGWSFSDKGEKRLELSHDLFEAARNREPLDIQFRAVDCEKTGTCVGIL